MPKDMNRNEVQRLVTNGAQLVEVLSSPIRMEFSWASYIARMPRSGCTKIISCMNAQNKFDHDT
jgi:hypothetical protein